MASIWQVTFGWIFHSNPAVREGHDVLSRSLGGGKPQGKQAPTQDPHTNSPGVVLLPRPS